MRHKPDARVGIHLQAFLRAGRQQSINMTELWSSHHSAIPPWSGAVFNSCLQRTEFQEALNSGRYLRVLIVLLGSLVMLKVSSTGLLLLSGLA